MPARRLQRPATLLVRCDGDLRIGQQPEDVAVAVVGGPCALAGHPAAGERHRAGHLQHARLCRCTCPRCRSTIRSSLVRSLTLPRTTAVEKSAGAVRRLGRLGLVGGDRDGAAVAVGQGQRGADEDDCGRPRRACWFCDLIENSTLPDLSRRFQSAPPSVWTTALSSICRRSGLAGGRSGLPQREEDDDLRRRR